MLLSVLVQQASKFLLLDEELKGKITVIAVTFYAIPELITVLEIPII